MESAERAGKERAWLLAVVALALVLRLFKLDAELWYDEILTLVNFVRLPFAELVTTYTSLNNHMLYSLEAKTVIALFGEHPWTLRLPAALFGVASVAVAYRLAREAVGPWEARLGALLLAISYHHVWFSQNARGYTGLLFFSLLGTLYFVRAARAGSKKLWVLYGVTIALAGYTHLTAALFFASHALVWAALFAARRFRSAEAMRRWEPYAGASGTGPLFGLGLGAGLTALLYAPVVPSMLGTFQKVTGSPAVQAAAQTVVKPSDGQWKNPLWTMLEIVRGFGELGPLLAIALPVALSLLVVGAVSLCRRNRLLASVYLVNVPFTMLVLVAAGFRLWPRYFFLDVAFVLFCLVRGLLATVDFAAARLGLSERVALVGARVGAGLAVLASLALLPKNYAYPKQNFEGALEYVEATRKPGDQVAAFGLARVPYSEYFHPPWTMVADAAELERVRALPGRTFVVYAFSGHAKSRHPDVMAVVSAEFSRDRKFVGTLGDGDVIVAKSER
jgi:mannosyltransferase